MVIKFQFYEERNNGFLGKHQNRLFTIFHSLLLVILCQCHVVYVILSRSFPFSSLSKILWNTELILGLVYFSLFGRDMNIRLLLRDNLRNVVSFNQFVCPKCICTLIRRLEAVWHEPRKCRILWRTTHFPYESHFLLKPINSLSIWVMRLKFCLDENNKNSD